MATTQVCGQTVEGSLESTIRQGAQMGLIADADLATGLSTVLANIDTRAAKKHVSIRQFAFAVKDAIRQIAAMTGGTSAITGGALSDIYTLLNSTWGVGFRHTL